MSLTVNSNISSLRADRALNDRTESLRSSFEKLATGKRINRASDDPAGLAVALSLLTESSTRGAASRNISDGISAAEIADGALATVSDITTQLAELAAQASNGTLTDSQRSALDQQYQALRSELDRISQTTEFNGQKLLNGSTTLTLQAGTSGDSSSQLQVSLPGASSTSLGLTSSIATQSGAQSALTETQTAVDAVSAARGQIGSAVSRLTSADLNNRATSIGEQEAASRILDADIAELSSRLTADQIGQNVAASIKAQANLVPQTVLKLLSS